MKVGDLVRCSPEIYGDENTVGIVLKVQYTNTANPDYRTPPSILVYSMSMPPGVVDLSTCTEWYDKNDLELLSKK